mmetsp:Transcript_2068/g.4481  ORF Transcript_2068/g.4481 Transcript_2068/m.4481 type:complete len:102 (-) Transcript_2068:289-594(-)
MSLTTRVIVCVLICTGTCSYTSIELITSLVTLGIVESVAGRVEQSLVAAASKTLAIDLFVASLVVDLSIVSLAVAVDLIVVSLWSAVVLTLSVLRVSVGRW